MFSTSIDYFTEDRSNILLTGSNRNIPPFFGVTPPSANLGEVEASGFEVELGYNQKFNPDFTLWAKLAITHNQNKVLFRDDRPLQFDYLKHAGYPIGQNRWLLRTEFYNNWDEVYASVPPNNDLISSRI